ncbi:MAG: hypothetical protein KKF06_03785, partial [Candidatus Margulisbacteria bacterium]|nr:hypothetical protein [Candidatus Margulisiibacteriota bacterium]
EPTTEAKVKIEAVGDSIATDESAGVFTILEGDVYGPTIEVTSPIAGDKWRGGSIHEITFTATDESGIKPNSLWIWYSTDEGTSYLYLITSEADISSPYSWTLPADISTTEAKIKVSLQDNSINQNWGTAESGSFTIEARVVPILLSVTLEAPSGGENWIAGMSYYISWETSGSPETINLYYTTSEALGYQLIEADLQDDGSYFWMIPDEPTTEAKVRIEAVKGGQTVTDESNALFTIEASSISVNLRDASDSSDYSTWEVGAAKLLNTVYIMATSECVIVKNEGNVPEDFSLSGVTTNWTLSSTGESGQEIVLLMGLFNGNISPAEVDFSTTSDIITTSQTWATQGGGSSGNYEGGESGENVASGGARKLYIYLRTPVAITTGAEERITVTVGCRKH